MPAAITLTPPHTDEVLRYMGMPPQQADEATRALVSGCARQLLDIAQPRWTYRVYELTFEADGVRLDCGLLLPGQSLKTHLTGCDRAVLFCATLGAQADRLIRRFESSDLLQALALDCCATATVEQLCDRAESQLQALFPGCHFPFRFSPGYGDLPIDLQGELLSLLDAPRQVGLCASAAHILTPRKSVTAILGVADHPIEPTRRSCQSCPVRNNCHYRKAGGHCGLL